MLGIFLIVLCFGSQASIALEVLSIYEIGVNSIKCDCTRISDLDVSQVKVQVNNFETGSNQTYLIGEAANAILSSEDFDENQCINIFIPGFNTPVYDPICQSAQCIFRPMSCNGKRTTSIIVDHYQYTKGSSNILQNKQTYIDAVKFVKSIGIAVGKLIVELLQKVARKLLNLIGHSLGAHVLGYSADYVANITEILLDSIYGADPAGPCYKDCPMEHLQKGQAQSVYSFHTTQVLGTNLHIADYDFISHNGKSQKGCPVGLIDIIGMNKQKCSHLKAVPITLTPVQLPGNWIAYKCPNYDDFEDKKCDNNENTLAGYMVKVTGSPGTYYFEPSTDMTCNIQS